jgi:hypothetical protein
MGYYLFTGIFTIVGFMKLFKNKIIIATALFLLLNWAGAFIILAPILVIIRNRLGLSAMSKNLWPIISSQVLADTIVNDVQMLSAYIISAMVILILYLLIRIFITGGIYDIIISETNTLDDSGDSRLSYFFKKSASLWSPFFRITLLAIIVYLAMIFLGFTVSRILSFLGLFGRKLIFLFFMLIGSTFLQIIRAKIAFESGKSVMGSIRSLRPILSKSLLRIIAGNLSVALAGFVISLLFWLILKGIRSAEWNPILAIISAILEQAIVFTICLMQVIRINFNCSIIRKGADDVVGGTELGRV